MPGSGFTGLLRGALVAVLALAPAGVASGDAAVDGFRTKLEKWVETRRILSEEQSDWEAERETLRATRDLLKQQTQALEQRIAELEESSTHADEERRELLLERGAFQRAAATLEEMIISMEREVLELAPRLPGPLQQRLEPLLVQIPETGGSTRIPLGQRLMNVLGVLAQAEKWNGTATFVAETRPVGEQELQVRTLYWGLGQAYYVDAQGRTAGIGRPGRDGWEFSDEPELADSAGLLLDIYEGNVDAIEFVPLSVEIR